MFNQQARAILWAQWRTVLNYLGAQRTGIAFPVIVSVLWYGLWIFGAVAAFGISAQPGTLADLRKLMPGALLLVLLYWQVIPILMVSTGSSLDLKKLRPYPIAPSQLFGIEVLLRLSTGIEMVILLVGLSLGLFRNPDVPAWGPLWLLPYLLFNMFCSAAVRDLLGRWLSRKRVRELFALFVVLCAALPQILLINKVPGPLREAMNVVPLDFWPWTAVGALITGEFAVMHVVVIAIWTFAAYAFGSYQFERSLSFDFDAAQASPQRDTKRASRWEHLLSLPSRFLPDPIGAMVEKELRSLSRTPRFRLVFMMGFSFGMLIWLPMARNGADRSSFLSTNYMAFVSLYSLMLMGEVSFWNAFGFDRSAVQAYFVTPVRFSSVLIAKNLTTAIFVLIEITIICVVCLLFRFPVSFAKAIEAFAVTTVMATFLMAMGNLGSVRGPRPTNPNQTWRSGASRVQAMLLIVYPLAVGPVGLAFLARYAFQTELAFYAVLLVDLMIGAVVYWLALESASSYIDKHRELFVSTLSKGEGPVAS